MNRPIHQIAVLLFLLVAMLAGCNIFGGAEPEQPADSGANSSGGEIALPTPSPPDTPVPQVAATSEPSATNDSNDSQDSDASKVDTGPEVGEITFALGATADYEPIEPNLFFTTGITEVHAIFDYSGMSPDYTWERVWTLNENEVARITEAWSGPDTGVFDSFINNSGRPLPAGDWLLEIYVEGELQSLGVFIIEEAE